MPKIHGYNTQICDILGVPLALEIIEGPSITLSFLGIILDICRIEARLPVEKLTRIQHTIADWLAKKKATKHEILSLVGQLQHATKVVRHGRISWQECTLQRQKLHNWISTPDLT